MIPELRREEILQWLSANGWSPDRDISDKAREFIDDAVAESAAEGFPVAPSDTAERFVHTYGLLHLRHSRDPDEKFITNPTGGYEGDFEEIAELSEEIGKSLFWVGYDLPEGSIFTLADDGGFYYIHHTGAFYIGPMNMKPSAIG
ncbi:SUKH-3 domain-containing protein [Streptomyces sp. NPDC048638]|uniref:SUKH-3 domain-containing protein n=1 Tax=Streptomyces sp. NPDC048638 TaxID=3365580 RepID=UPI0037109BED